MATEGEMNALVGRQVLYQIAGPPHPYPVPGVLEKVNGDLRRDGEYEIVIGEGDDTSRVSFHRREVTIRGTTIINIS